MRREVPLQRISEKKDRDEWEVTAVGGQGGEAREELGGASPHTNIKKEEEEPPNQ